MSIVIYFKNMAGDCLPLNIDPVQGVEGMRRALGMALQTPYSIQFLRENDEKNDETETEAPYNGEVVHYLINEDYFILNLTAGFYAVCSEANRRFHNEIMKEFMAPLNAREALLPDDFHTSHWLPTDKIVFVPAHLKEFVARQYQRLV